jgi:hypothetical protein
MCRAGEVELPCPPPEKAQNFENISRILTSSIAQKLTTFARCGKFALYYLRNVEKEAPQFATRS